MRYLIFDLDDTLLNSESKISNYTLEGLHRLRAKGFILVINTARSIKATQKNIDIIKPDYSILNGGSLILDKDKNIIFKTTIDNSITNIFVDLFNSDKNVREFSIQTIDYLYTSNISYIEKFPTLSKYFNFKNKFIENNILKIIFESYDLNKYKKLANDNNLYFIPYFNSNWVRIAKSTKYLGNLKLFNFLNDNDPKDYTFGDDYGDLEMIEKAYCGVLLKNSCVTFKDNYRQTLYDNNNDGLIRYMEDKIEF